MRSDITTGQSGASTVGNDVARSPGSVVPAAQARWSRGRRGFDPIPDTTQIPVSPRIARDIQWEVGRRWSVDPDRIQLSFGAPSGTVPDRVVAVRILGTGSGGHWIALLSPSDPTATPVRVRIRAGVERLVPVASRRIDRGTGLTASDITFESHVHWGPPAGSGLAIEPGWVAQRVVRAGEELKRPAVSEPNAVETGEVVEIVWKRGAVAVSLQGVALGTGPAGTVVRVKTDNGRQLIGVAQAPGLVVVGATPEEDR